MTGLLVFALVQWFVGLFGACLSGIGAVAAGKEKPKRAILCGVLGVGCFLLCFNGIELTSVIEDYEAELRLQQVEERLAAGATVRELIDEELLK